MKIQRTIAQQVTRQVVFYPATNAFGDAQRLLLIGHNALVAFRWLLWVEIVAVIPLLSCGRDTTPELMWHPTQNGVCHPACQGNHRLMLPAETFRKTFCELQADA